jgi:tRNA nucleotidyltransferase/poly(A) polymerase
MIPTLEKLINDLRSQRWVQSLIKQSKDVWIVGGIVRDAYLGKKSKDVDLVVEGLPFENILSILRPFGRVSIEGESFSVIKFKPRGFEGEPYDIAVPRADRKIGKGHKGFNIVTDGISIEEDLRRRDFTINSMAVNVETGEFLDPFNGIEDLKKQQLRATDPNAFVEDALRMLRGIQFASRFGFSIAPDTLKLMRENAHLIKEISGERIFGELMKILLKNGDTNLAFQLISKSGLDKALFGKKMLSYEGGLENLDPASFFYVLGLLGDVDDVAKFIKNILKGDNLLVDQVRAIDHIMEVIPRSNEEDKLFYLFKIFNKVPDVMDAVILPQEVDEIILDMRTGKIPMTPDNIPITGDDIKMMGNLKEGPEIGFVKEKIIRDALMNRFNWKSRDDSIEYLSELLS